MGLHVFQVDGSRVCMFLKQEEASFVIVTAIL